MTKFDKEIRLTYGCHQIFIRLGFDPADLYVGINWGRVILVAAPGHAGLEDQSQLEKVKRFVFTVCQTEMYESSFRMRWLEAVEQINNLQGVTTTDRDRMVAEFEANLDRAGLVMALVAKGMMPGREPTPSTTPTEVTS